MFEAGKMVQHGMDVLYIMHYQRQTGMIHKLKGTPLKYIKLYAHQLYTHINWHILNYLAHHIVTKYLAHQLHIQTDLHS